MEFAYKLKAENPSCSVCWVNGRDPTTFSESYSDIATYLATSPSELKNIKVLKIVPVWLEQRCQSWLMIIDNADNSKTIFNVFKDSQNNDCKLYYLYSSYWLRLSMA